MTKIIVKSGWYHDASDSHETTIKYFEVDPWTINSYENFWAGPFKTFSDAKKDAIDYFRSDMREAQWSMRYLKAKRKPKNEAALEKYAKAKRKSK